jgi:hypothetical protein
VAGPLAWAGLPAGAGAEPGVRGRVRAADLAARRTEAGARAQAGSGGKRRPRARAAAKAALTPCELVDQAEVRSLPAACACGG